MQYLLGYLLLGILILSTLITLCYCKFFTRVPLSKLSTSPLVPSKQYDLYVSIPTCHFPNVLASLPKQDQIEIGYKNILELSKLNSVKLNSNIQSLVKRSQSSISILYDMPYLYGYLFLGILILSFLITVGYCHCYCKFFPCVSLSELPRTLLIPKTQNDFSSSIPTCHYPNPLVSLPQKPKSFYI
ncbi:hypothetical protein RN001_000307 [Aquatica leii]|uniref:Uncharacterized protein n=1 Tax=Aquatica leii TaxID=1421715 RepID=A0AAN7PJY1_9COLE|nr:hypothetical protein RN001_000307 [Aquatica leii]